MNSETHVGGLSIVLFWVGLTILLWIARSYQSTTRAIRRASRLQGELEGALAERRARLRRILPQDATIGRVCEASDYAVDIGERFACEQDIDGAISRFLSTETRGRTAPTDRAKACQLIESADADLRPFRERYNEAASLVNTRRLVMPGALVARSLIGTDLPEIPDDPST